MEMYKEKLAVAVKHNGKILRETKDLVHLPFGSEFSVLVKNLNSKRVKFTLHIDGTDVLGGEEIIVNSNSEVEMKRFIRNGNMNEGNAFKFIERTQAIEDGPRGVKVDDGVIRIEYWFEQDQAEIKVADVYWNKHHYNPYRTDLWGITYGNGAGISGISGSLGDSYATSASATSASSALRSVNTVTAQSQTLNSAKFSTDQQLANDAGITVPGSKVDQKFTPVYGFKAEVNSHVIILRMVGVVGNVEVVAPVTVSTKQKCSTCGKVNKITSGYCSSCGTSLTLL